MDGGVVEVLGNAQDQVGNTMNAGEVIIRGRCGDAAGYAMRGGRIFVRDGCGWRAGIHMKEYGEKRPVVVIGRDAGSFLGASTWRAVWWSCSARRAIISPAACTAASSI